MFVSVYPNVPVRLPNIPGSVYSVSLCPSIQLACVRLPKCSCVRLHKRSLCPSTQTSALYSYDFACDAVLGRFHWGPGGAVHGLQPCDSGRDVRADLPPVHQRQALVCGRATPHAQPHQQQKPLDSMMSRAQTIRQQGILQRREPC